MSPHVILLAVALAAHVIGGACYLGSLRGWNSEWWLRRGRAALAGLMREASNLPSQTRAWPSLRRNWIRFSTSSTSS